MIFREQHVSSRQQTEYWQKDQRKFTFVEHWCQEQWEAVKLLSTILSGGGRIQGHPIESSFSRSYFDRQPHPNRPDFWTGWELRSTRDQDANWKEIHVPQGRLTALGLKSYRGPDEAINEWIFGVQSHNPVGADVPTKNTIITFLPDSRGRLLDASWKGGELHLELIINISPEQVELQIHHEDSSNAFQTIPVVTGQSKYTAAIPSDAESLTILLLDNAGQPIFEQNLDQNNRTFGKSDAHSGKPKQGTTLLDSAELIDIDELPAILDDGAMFELRSQNQSPPKTPLATGNHQDKRTANSGSEPAGTGTILMPSIAIFISHSNLDQEIAENLTEVIKNSLEINPSLIRCTSVEGHRLQGGAFADAQLREEIIEARSFIGLLTPQSLGSAYVLFELGARWGADRRLIPLLAAGLKHGDLKGPLTAIHGHSCESASEIHQLVDELAEILRVDKRPVSSYQRYVERLVKASHKTGVSSKRRLQRKQQVTNVSNAPISIRIEASTFMTANQRNHSDPAIVNIYFRLEIEYTGQKTTLRPHDIHIHELSLNKASSYFIGERNQTLDRLSLEPGYSGIVKYTVTGIATKLLEEIPAEITGEVIFKETFTGNLPELSFRAVRDS